MSWRNNIILFLILLVLGGWYYFYEIKGDAKRNIIKSEERRIFPGLSSTEVMEYSFERIVNFDNQIQIDTDKLKQRFSFSQEDGKWFVSDPVNTLANQEIVGNLLDQIVNLESEKQLKVPSVEFDTYGLNSPAYIISLEIKNKDGQLVTYQFKIGNDNPTNDYVYTISNQKENILLIDNSIKSQLNKDLFYYRSKDIVPIMDSTVKMLAYTRENAPRIAVNRNGNDWSMTSPYHADGDDSRIRGLINKLTSLKIEEFVSEEMLNPKDYGLSEPSLEIEIVCENDDEFLVKLGNKSDPGGKFYYALRDKYKPVFTVSRDIFDAFTGKPFDLRNKDVCEFQREFVNKIDIQTPEENLIIEKLDSGDWQVIHPNAIPTDQLAIGTLLSDLQYLKATGVSDQRESIGNTHIRIHLYMDASDVPYEIVIGDNVSEGVGRLVRTSEHEYIYIISEKDADSFLKSEFDLRDKKLIQYDMNKFEALELTSKKGVKFRIQKNKNKFELISHEDYGIDSDNLENLVWNCSNIEMGGIPKFNDLENVKFETPILTIKAFTTDGSLGPLLIADSPSDRYYAKLQMDEEIVEISEGQLKDIIDSPLFNSQ